jgi:hypothetical protein
MATYKISRAGAVLGEYDEAIVRRYLDAGSIKLHDYGWTEGMTEWKQLHELGFRVNIQAAPLGATALAPSAVAADLTEERPFAYYAWMVAAFFAPYLFGWRIIFDKTLGYAKGVKVIYAVWALLALSVIVTAVSSDGRSYSARDIEARSANPYAVRGNQEEPINAGAVMNIARNLIKGALKAPSSAKFSEYSKTNWQKTYDDGTKQFYVVSGWVESQNSFGAMLRANYLICFSADGTNVVPSFVRLGEKEEGVIPVECKPAFK